MKYLFSFILAIALVHTVLFWGGFTRSNTPANPCAFVLDAEEYGDPNEKIQSFDVLPEEVQRTWENIETNYQRARFRAASSKGGFACPSSAKSSAALL